MNIKVEATITDQQPGAPPVRKAMSVVVGDSLQGGVRTIAALGPPGGPVPMNMDVQPNLLADGKIRLRLTLQYDLRSTLTPGRDAGGDERSPTRTSINQSLTLILESGKPLVAAQSADPVSDRQVTLEVKATVLR